MELAHVATKKCRTCGETKPIAAFDERRGRRKRGTQCKDCRRAEQRERWRSLHPPKDRVPRRIGAAEAFVCTRCGQLKPAAEFAPRKRGEPKLHAWCRTCGHVKLLSEFDARADTERPGTQCKDCRRMYQNESNARSNPGKPRAARAADTAELLMCTRCRELKPAKAFPRKWRGKDRLHAWCRDCFAEIHALQYAANRDREISRIRRNKARRRDEARLVVAGHLATHPCVDCGEGDPSVLEFDHVSTKRAEISRMVADGYPVAEIVTEIAKCEVRCGNCHRRRTHERRLTQEVKEGHRSIVGLAA